MRGLFKKVAALTTTACFLLTALPVTDILAALPRLSESAVSTDCLISPSLGKTTRSLHFPGAPTAVIIQDLHCHSQVQRTIASILARIDQNNNLTDVFVEGASGGVDTSWLSAIRDTALRREVVEHLVSEGLLTGGEYYSFTAHKPRLLKGMEDKQLHEANILRLGTLLGKKGSFDRKMNVLASDLAAMEAAYLGERNRRFTRTIRRYRNGGLPAEKFYRLLENHAKAINRMPGKATFLPGPISLERFPATRAYRELVAQAHRLNHRKISLQAPEFLFFLKQQLPYAAYQSLTNGAFDPLMRDDLYDVVADLALSPRFSSQRKYFPELYAFFDYRVNSRKLDPLALIEEERRLTAEIRMGYAETIGELEVSFLSDSFNCFSDYLSLSLSARDYAFFSRRFEKFKTLWNKYSLHSHLTEFSDDFKLIDEYYQANIKRNDCFIENIPPLKAYAKNSSRRTARDTGVIVIIAGGFHTEGLTALLARQRVSCLVVTPRVTADTVLSHTTYVELAQHQARILTNALALGLASQSSSREQFELILRGANRLLPQVGNDGKSRIVREIETATGVHVSFESHDNIITFDNGARIRLKQKGDGHLAAVFHALGGTLSPAIDSSIRALIKVEELGAASIKAAAGDPYDFVKIVLTLAAKLRLIQGSGIIPAIAEDPLWDATEHLDGIPVEILARFPFPVQEIVLHVVRQKEAFSRLSAELLQAPTRHGLVAMLLAAGILEPYIRTGNVSGEKPGKALSSAAASLGERAPPHLRDLVINGPVPSRAPRSHLTERSAYWHERKTIQNYDADEVISALQKEIRKGNAREAKFWAYELLRSGEQFADKAWQRLLVMTIEDVGPANPQAIQVLWELHKRFASFNPGSTGRRQILFRAVSFLCDSPKDRYLDEVYLLSRIERKPVTDAAELQRMFETAFERGDWPAAALHAVRLLTAGEDEKKRILLYLVDRAGTSPRAAHDFLRTLFESASWIQEKAASQFYLHGIGVICAHTPLQNAQELYASVDDLLRSPLDAGQVSWMEQTRLPILDSYLDAHTVRGKAVGRAGMHYLSEGAITANESSARDRRVLEEIQSRLAAQETSPIPSAVSAAADNLALLLSQQGANIIFEKNPRSGAWIFRRGAIDLAADPYLAQQLGNIIESKGHSSLLIRLRKEDARALKAAVLEAVLGSADLQLSLQRQGIMSFYHYKRILLVAPFGDMNGEALHYATPHKGLESLAYRLRREVDDVDVIVYNPNLTSRESLYEFVRHNRFDVIGVSILQSVMKANIEILGRLSLLSPDSLVVAGGTELRRFPFQEVFDSLPVDVLSFDRGTSLVRMAQRIAPEDNKSTRLAKVRDIPNIFLAPEGQIIRNTFQADPFLVSSEMEEDIPFEKADVVHGGHYDKSKDNATQPVFWDKVGRQTFRIHLGNFCRGHCIFCGTERNTQHDLPPDTVMKLIRTAPVGTDSLHFECADFFNSPEKARALTHALAQDPEIRNIPKLAVARTDEIADGSILFDCARAGFHLISYGIESFNTTVLTNIGKGTTREQNINALESTLFAGIKPGINLILYTPWDTVASTIDSMEWCLYFLERGAHINVVPYIVAGFGRPVTRRTELMEYEIYDFPGLKKPFSFPRRGKILDPELNQVADTAMHLLRGLLDYRNLPEWTQASITLYSLFIFKSFAMALDSMKISGTTDPRLLLSRIDAAIGRLIRSELSSLKRGNDPEARGIIEDKANPFNKIVTEAILRTEDGRRIGLFGTGNTEMRPGMALPDELTYDIYALNDDGKREDHKGYVTIRTDGARRITSRDIMFRGVRESDAFMSRAINAYLDLAEISPSTVLLNPQADYHRFSVDGHFPRRHYRIPSPMVDGAAQGEIIRQVDATYRQGYPSLARKVQTHLSEALAIPFQVPEWSRSLPQRAKNLQDRLNPAWAVSRMVLSFTGPESSPESTSEFIEKTIRNGVAAVSVRPEDVPRLPLRELREAGIRVSVVAPAASDHNENRWKEIRSAIEAGGEEIDFEVKHRLQQKDRSLSAEQSLASVIRHVRQLRQDLLKHVRLNVIIDPSAAPNEDQWRIDCRRALNHADILTLTAGGKGITLKDARAAMEEVFLHYQKTGELKGIEISGGIAAWDVSSDPDRSARAYAALAGDVFGDILGSHYLFERDLFRLGGDGILESVRKSVDAGDCPYASGIIPFSPADYPQLAIPAPEAASFTMEEYVSGKFPDELLRIIRQKEHRIEIHRGSIIATASYLKNLTLRGYAVTPLPDANSPYKFFRVEKGGVSTYIVSNLVGETRELFILQSIAKFFSYPPDRISIRVFDEGDLGALYHQTLGKYAGQIGQVVIRGINSVIRLAAEDEALGLTIIERLQGPYVDAVVMQKRNGELVLLFEIGFASGIHMKHLVDYLVAPVEKGGMGINDVTLVSACGGIGKEIQLNDLIVYSDLYWARQRIADASSDDINIEELAALVPDGVRVHRVPVFNMPTVLNGSLDLIKTIAAQGEGALELETVHAARATRRIPGVRFRAIYEVHDKPATSASDKGNAIGGTVPAQKDKSKLKRTGLAIAHFLFDGFDPLGEDRREPTAIPPSHLSTEELSLLHHISMDRERVPVSGAGGILRFLQKPIVAGMIALRVPPSRAVPLYDHVIGPAAENAVALTVTAFLFKTLGLQVSLTPLLVYQWSWGLFFLLHLADLLFSHDTAAPPRLGNIAWAGLIAGVNVSFSFFNPSLSTLILLSFLTHVTVNNIAPLLSTTIAHIFPGRTPPRRLLPFVIHSTEDPARLPDMIARASMINASCAARATAAAGIVVAAKPAVMPDAYPSGYHFSTDGATDVPVWAGISSNSIVLYIDLDNIAPGRKDAVYREALADLIAHMGGRNGLRGNQQLLRRLRTLHGKIGIDLGANDISPDLLLSPGKDNDRLSPLLSPGTAIRSFDEMIRSAAIEEYPYLCDAIIAEKNTDAVTRSAGLIILRENATDLADALRNGKRFAGKNIMRLLPASLLDGPPAAINAFVDVEHAAGRHVGVSFEREEDKTFIGKAVMLGNSNGIDAFYFNLSTVDPGDTVLEKIAGELKSDSSIYISGVTQKRRLPRRICRVLPCDLQNLPAVSAFDSKTIYEITFPRDRRIDTSTLAALARIPLSSSVIIDIEQLREQVSGDIDIIDAADLLGGVVSLLRQGPQTSEEKRDYERRYVATMAATGQLRLANDRILAMVIQQLSVSNSSSITPAQLDTLAAALGNNSVASVHLLKYAANGRVTDSVAVKAFLTCLAESLLIEREKPGFAFANPEMQAVLGQKLLEREISGIPTDRQMIKNIVEGLGPTAPANTGLNAEEYYRYVEDNVRKLDSRAANDPVARDAIIELLLLWAEPKWQRGIDKRPKLPAPQGSRAIQSAA